MDFSLSEERKMLQETVARFFESNYQNINKRNENVNLPEGFSIEIFADNVKAPRQMAEGNKYIADIIFNKIQKKKNNNK